MLLIFVKINTDEKIVKSRRLLAAEQFKKVWHATLAVAEKPIGDLHGPPFPILAFYRGKPVCNTLL